jgi:hypothetical protein
LPIKTPTEIEIEKYGSFFGVDFSDEHLDDLVYHHLDFIDTKPLAQMERELFTCKWFDYRFMHYAKATYLFADCYAKTYRVAYAKHKDTISAKHMKPVKEPNILLGTDKNLLAGLWTARWIADSLCMPYDFFISNSIEQAMLIKRNYLPRPNQLYGTPTDDVVTQRWKEFSQARFIQAIDPRYQTQHYLGLPDQDAHRKWVLDLAAGSSNPAHPLKHAMTVTLTITADTITERFGPDMLQRVLEL